MPLPLAQAVPLSNPGLAPQRLQKNCQVCGFQNLEVDLRCQKCGRRLQPLHAPELTGSVEAVAPAIAAEPAQPPAPVVPAMPEHVRSEIHTRVERFKARRRAQTLPLPFEEQVLPEAGNVVAFPTLEPEPPAKPARGRASREAKLAESLAALAPTEAPAAVPAAEVEAAVPEIPVALPEAPATTFPPLVATPLETAQPMASSPAESVSTPKEVIPQFPLFVPPTEQPEAAWTNFQIASMSKRLSGIGHDLANILCGVLLFAAPFYWIAGKPHLNLRVLAGFIGGALVIALFYGILFMIVAGETPGMTASGLRVVSFSGHSATWQQRLLRVVGALVSAGSFLFGYLWVFIDEEKLYWHDHISKTVLTDSTE